MITTTTNNMINGELESPGDTGKEADIDYRKGHGRLCSDRGKKRVLSPHSLVGG